MEYYIKLVKNDQIILDTHNELERDLAFEVSITLHFAMGGTEENIPVKKAQSGVANLLDTPVPQAYSQEEINNMLQDEHEFPGGVIDWDAEREEYLATQRDNAQFFRDQR